jgi:hypothetical protein
MPRCRGIAGAYMLASSVGNVLDAPPPCKAEGGRRPEPEGFIHPR